MRPGDCDRGWCGVTALATALAPTPTALAVGIRVAAGRTGSAFAAVIGARYGLFAGASIALVVRLFLLFFFFPVVVVVLVVVVVVVLVVVVVVVLATLLWQGGIRGGG